jgi:hypothetical protein
MTLSALHEDKNFARLHFNVAVCDMRDVIKYICEEGKVFRLQTAFGEGEM